MSDLGERVGEQGPAQLAAAAGPVSALVGIGIDQVNVERFARLLERRPAAGLRLFTDAEREYASELVRPVPSLAARFAAKEAVMKALGVGVGAFSWHDVEVVRQASGRPVLCVRGRAAALAGAAGVGGWQVSLTHTSLTACAVVVALGRSTDVRVAPA